MHRSKKYCSKKSIVLTRHEHRFYAHMFDGVMLIAVLFVHTLNYESLKDIATFHLYQHVHGRIMAESHRDLKC